MDSSSGQHQEMESMLVCSKAQQDQRKPRPQPEQALKCPRCESTNTKFCYYNNYSLSQPRYFCKSCRRYWTKGGTLRNVPVGGGCRKNKRSSSSSSSSSSSKRSQDQPLISSNTNHLTNFPHLSYDSNDLSLAFARLQKQNGGQLGFDDQHDFSLLGNPKSTHYDILANPSISSSSNATTPAFLDALRNGFLDIHNNFQNLHYGFGNGSNMGEAHHHHHHDHGLSAEMLMPFGDHDHHQMSATTNATTAAVTVPTMKQEFCNSRESESNKVLWGFPWQLNNADAGINNELSSTWHGLLNSPLI